jgi:hypothetical protein
MGIVYFAGFMALAGCGSSGVPSIEDDLKKLNSQSLEAVSLTPDSIKGIWKNTDSSTNLGLRYLRVDDHSVTFAYQCLSGAPLELSADIHPVFAGKNGYLITRELSKASNSFCRIELQAAALIPYAVSGLEAVINLDSSGTSLKKVSDLLR